MRGTEDPMSRLHNRLRIDKDDLDEELIEHPTLIEDVGMQHALAMSDYEAQKEYLKHIAGRIESASIDRLQRGGVTKPTASQRDNAIEADEEWQRERAKLLKMSRTMNEWLALKEAFIARGYALHNLTGLAIARMKADGGMSEFGGPSRDGTRR